MGSRTWSWRESIPRGEANGKNKGRAQAPNELINLPMMVNPVLFRSRRNPVYNNKTIKSTMPCHFRCEPQQLHLHNLIDLHGFRHLEFITVARAGLSNTMAVYQVEPSSAAADCQKIPLISVIANMVTLALSFLRIPFNPPHSSNNLSFTSAMFYCKKLGYQLLVKVDLIT